MTESTLTLELRSYSTETRTHSHDYHQLVLPVFGDLSMNVGSKAGSVSSEQLAVIASGQDHEFAAPKNNTFVVADVPATLAPELERLPAFITLDSDLAQYVTFLHQQLHTAQVSQTSERQMLLLLIQLLQERYGEVLRVDRRIEAARIYLDEQFQQAISLTELSTIANISPRQLSELFRRQMGMTPQQYLTEKRMQHAWGLLETSNLSVQQIADRVGYKSLASFSDRFRKHFGRPPSFFRKIDK